MRLERIERRERVPVIYSGWDCALAPARMRAWRWDRRPGPRRMQAARWRMMLRNLRRWLRW